MKKFFSIAIAAILVVSLAAVNVLAGCFSMAGGCQTETVIKQADPALVIKDGIIGDGEYVEVAVNRDSATTDLVLSYERDELYGQAEAFLPNVRFFMSWDVNHGLNVAIQSVLLEEPKNLSFQPDNTYYEGDLGFPGDEFLFQFGMMFAVADKNGNTVMYRGISKNTETGEHLYGHYGAHGYTGVLNQTAGTDYIVAIDGNTVTYEISFPLASVLPSDKINGTAPVENADMLFSTSATGGSKGMLHLYSDDDRNTTGEESACYAISLGDGGFMSTPSGFTNPSDALGRFTGERITELDTTQTTVIPDPGPADTTIDIGPVPTDTTIDIGPVPTDITILDPVDPTPITSATDENGDPVPEPITSATDEKGDPIPTPGTSATDEKGNPVPTDKPISGSSDNRPNAPQTADAGIIAAVVSVLSAAGFAISRKHK